jgi:hypothetical protein
VIEPAASFVAHVGGRARMIYMGVEEPANRSALTDCHWGKQARSCLNFLLSKHKKYETIPSFSRSFQIRTAVLASCRRANDDRARYRFWQGCKPLNTCRRERHVLLDVSGSHRLRKHNLVLRSHGNGQSGASRRLKPCIHQCCDALWKHFRVGLGCPCGLRRRVDPSSRSL